MVKRVWFPNTPSGMVDTPQKYQLLIGYPFGTPGTGGNGGGNGPVSEAELDYYRRYLNDPREVVALASTHQSSEKQ